MNRTRWNPLSRTLAVVLLLAATFALLPGRADARYRFEEGDWIAWGDTRTFYDFSVGRNTIYVSTDDGVLRWDRNRNVWLFPWFTVPGPLDRAVILKNVRMVREDPLTLDVYVRLKAGQWLRRSNGSQRWDTVDSLPADVRERIPESATVMAKPGPHVIMPDRYLLGPDNELKYDFSTWDFSGGTEDEWGRAIFGWTGFGAGTLNRNSPVLKLYPGGPGPATAMDMNGDVIWCASVLDRQDGWAWSRDRREDHWEYYQPDNVWGLEPGDVNAIRIGADGSVWFATTEGLMYRSGRNWRALRKTDGLPRSEVYDVEPFGTGAWVATLSGMAFVDESSGIVLHPDEKTEPVPYSDMFYQLASSGDTLYAAGGSMLLSYTQANGWQEVNVPGIVSAGTVPTALMARPGLIAIGDRNGFAWRDSTGWHEAFSRQWRDGVVLSIAYHGGYFWLGTDRGLVKYDPVEKDAIRYTTEDGLAGNTVFEVHPEGDYLWLGTDVALVRFYWNAPGRLD